MKIKDLKNKKIAILGFGKEGQSSYNFLEKQGIKDITLFDKNSENVEIFFENIKKRPKTYTGENYLEELGHFDIIIKSPGICPFQKELHAHRSRFISQTEIFFANYTGKVIGITGTKGKSTVSTLLYQCLQQAEYDVKLVGNIGSPVLDEIDIASGEVYDFVVYEMSSYMLQDFIPKLYIGVLNNIYPCHLDWHGNMEVYKNAKINILRDAEYKVINGDFYNQAVISDFQDEGIYFNSAGKYTYKKEGFFIDSHCVFRDSDLIALSGEHNKKNITAILAILDIILGDFQKIEDIFSEILPFFTGLPHRIEDIGTFEGIRFINDAIATTPESTIAAIETFEPELQTLFLGGQDSGFRFDKIRKKILESHVQNVIAFPDTSEKIFPEIELRDYEKAFEIEIEGRILQIIKTRSMKTGVDFAYKTTFPGRVALLSCAAPSFSLWKNYIEKANQFKKEVQNY